MIIYNYKINFLIQFKVSYLDAFVLNHFQNELHAAFYMYKTNVN